MAIYKPYKQGTMSRNQARVMKAVGDIANLRKIINETGLSAQAAANLVNSLIQAELLEAIEV